MAQDGQDTNRLFSRRTYIAALSASSVALAGCSGGGDDSESDGGDSTETDGTDSGTADNGGDGSPESQNGGSGIEPITRSGDGSTSGETVQLQDGLVVSEASHEGTGEFRIFLEGGQVRRSLASDQGGYEGENATYTENREYTLNVVADGAWDLTIRQPRTDSAPAPPETYTGSGDEVVGPIDLSEQGTARLSHDGEFNITVDLFPQVISSSNPLFVSGGEFTNEETPYPSYGICWVGINANASWTLELE